MVMKTHLPILAGAFLLLGLAPSVGAQIRDNESSANALAIQCAVSSGFSALDYGDYCRRLAKTIGKLNSEQQTRVFGYLPMPGGGSRSADDAAAATDSLDSPLRGDAGVGTSAGETSATASSPTRDAAGSPQATAAGGLSVATATNAGAVRAPSSEGGASAWDTFLQWFRDASAANESASQGGPLKDNEN